MSNFRDRCFFIDHGKREGRGVAFLYPLQTPKQHDSQCSYLHFSWSFGCSEFLLLLVADPNCFRAIVDERLSEPGVLQCLFRCDSLLGIVDEDPLQ
jgi:hypothetical protein